MSLLCVNLMVPSVPSSSRTVKTSNVAHFLERVTPAPKANLLSPAPSSIDDLNSQLQKLKIKSGVDYFTLGICGNATMSSVPTAFELKNDPRSSGGDDADSVMVENDLTGGDGGNNNSCNTTDKKFGHLCFSYFAVSSPYKKIPLRKKVAELATKYPSMMTLRCVDLSPASWMAIAW
ncbi:hypothetical protein LINPERPRIM_LOCUS798 [Linum perenne]